MASQWLMTSVFWKYTYHFNTYFMASNSLDYEAQQGTGQRNSWDYGQQFTTFSEKKSKYVL